MNQNMEEYQDMQDDKRQGWVELFEAFIKEKGVDVLGKEDAVELMRICGTDPTDAEVDEYMTEMDKNDDTSTIDCEEFCFFMKRQTDKGDPIELLKEAFDYYDKDESGFIERHELKAILSDCGQNPDDEDLIEGMLEIADINRDGKISIIEFVREMHNLND